MPVLKNIKVDDIEDVTILIMKDVVVRYSFTTDNQNLHIAISEADKLTEEVVAVCEDGSEIVDTTQMSNIDIIIDFPSKENLQQTIDLYTKILNEWNDREA